MENCFVSKLKDSVNNDNLSILGILKIKVTHIDGAVEKNSVIRLNPSTQITITCDNGNHLATSYAGLSNPVHSLTLTANVMNNIYLDNANYTIYVPKYDITIINNNVTTSVADNIASVKLEELEYSSLTNVTMLGSPYTTGNLSSLKDLRLTTLRIRKSEGIVGNINELSDVTTLQTLVLNTSVTGNISALGKLTRLTNLEFDDGSNYLGDIVDFVKAQVSNNRTSCNDGTFGLIKGNRAIKLNGVVPVDTSDSYLSWESASKIAIKGKTEIFVYCYGYTDEEIATNTATGGIWEGKTVTKCD